MTMWKPLRYPHVPLSAEQLELLYKEFTRKLRLEEQAQQRDRAVLPPEILEEMEHSSKADLRNNLKRYIKDVQQYEGGDWTTGETINKIFVSDLKMYQVDAHQVVDFRYKDADRLRVAARAATEIYQQLKFIAERGRDPSDEEIILQSIEQLRRLAVYGFATAKTVDQEAKELATKALRLPDAVKYLEDNDDGDKKIAFSSEMVQQITKARYESTVLRSAMSNNRAYYRQGRGNFRGNFNRPTRCRAFFLAKAEFQRSPPPSHLTNPTPAAQATATNNNQRAVDNTINIASTSPDHSARPEYTLLSAGGRYSSWGQADSLSDLLAADHNTSMAIVSDIGRLQDPISYTPNALATTTNQVNSNRTPGSRRSRLKVPFRRYYRRISYSKRRLPFKLLHYPRKIKETTNPQLPKAKSIRPMHTFQDGRGSSPARHHRTRRLSRKNRSESRLRRRSDSSRFKTISHLQAQSKGLPIQIVGVRSKCRRASFFPS